MQYEVGAISESIYPSWYLISQLSVCGMASIIFFILYKHPTPHSSPMEKGESERGLLFVSLATFTWALWPAVALFWGISEELRIYFSILNNVFLLLVAAFFENGPRSLRFFQLHERWIWFVITGGLVVASFTSNIDNLYWKNIPDVLLSTITLVVLGWAICLSLYHRIMKEAAILAALIVVYVFYAQLLEINSLFNTAAGTVPSESRLIILLTSKTLLIMMLLLVAITWLHEKWALQVKENSLVLKPERPIAIKITGKRDPENNRRFLVKTAANENGKTVESVKSITHKPHQLLLQFALRKRYKQLSNEGMMNTISDCFYHSDLNKIHAFLGLDVPTLFKNCGRNGSYIVRDTVHIEVDEEMVSHDPDLKAVLVLEQAKTQSE